MAYKITDDCISCGACEPECPNSAISEGETVLQHSTPINVPNVSALLNRHSVPVSAR